MCYGNNHWKNPYGSKIHTILAIMDNKFKGKTTPLRPYFKACKCLLSISTGESILQTSVRLIPRAAAMYSPIIPTVSVRS